MRIQISLTWRLDKIISAKVRESEKSIVMLDSVDLLVRGLRFPLFFLREETV